MGKPSHGMDMVDTTDTDTHTDTDTMVIILESDLLMPNQKLTLKPSHGTDMDMLDIMDTDTMVTILERDLLMLSQKLTLTPSHGMDMDIVDIMGTPIDTDTVVTTGDRFLCHQY